MSKWTSLSSPQTQTCYFSQLWSSLNLGAPLALPSRTSPSHLLGIYLFYILRPTRFLPRWRPHSLSYVSGPRSVHPQHSHTTHGPLYSSLQTLPSSYFTTCYKFMVSKPQIYPFLPYLKILELNSINIAPWREGTVSVLVSRGRSRETARGRCFSAQLPCGLCRRLSDANPPMNSSHSPQMASCSPVQSASPQWTPLPSTGPHLMNHSLTAGRGTAPKSAPNFHALCQPFN